MCKIEISFSCWLSARRDLNISTRSPIAHSQPVPPLLATLLEIVLMLKAYTVLKTLYDSYSPTFNVNDPHYPSCHVIFSSCAFFRCLSRICCPCFRLLCFVRSLFPTYCTCICIYRCQLLIFHFCVQFKIIYQWFDQRKIK